MRVWAAVLLGLGIASWTRAADASGDDCSQWMQIGRAEKAQAEQIRADGGGVAGKEMQAHLEKALHAFTKAAQACPDSAGGSLTEVASRLGYIHHKEEHWQDACTVYVTLLQIDPKRTLDRTLYADALQEAGRFDEAAEQFKTLLAADPKNAALYCNLALLYALDLEDGPEAIETVQKGLAARAPEPCLTYAWGKGLELGGVDMLESGDAGRGLELLREAKVKLLGLQDDSDFGEKAKEEIGWLNRLIDHGEQSRKTREKR